MVEDKDIKTPKSPFAMRQNEVKVFDGKEGYASVNQVVFKVDMGYINETHFSILEIINDFEFITSRQIYQIMSFKGIEIKSQDKVNDKLEDLIKSKVVSRYYFSSDEGKGIFRVYCLEKIGKHLLTSRNIKCDWVPTDNTKPVYMLKRKLSANQILLAYMRKVAAFKSYRIEPTLVSKKQNSKFKPSVTVAVAKDTKSIDFLFEVVRRNAGWAEKFLEKIVLYKEFYEYFQTKDGGFEYAPQLVIIGEDDAHLVEIFKIITKNKIVLKGIENIYYTTDLRQLDDNLERSLIAFRFDETKNKYIMDILEMDILKGEVLPPAL